MDIQPPSTIKNEMRVLRQGIRTRYRAYQQADPDRYPVLDFNTNRANYTPLRDSFEEEFYRVRGYDEKTPTINIPSTATLAQLFTDEDYVPGKKILNTCLSYAEGPSQAVVRPNEEATSLPQAVAVRSVRWQLVGILLSMVVLGGLLFAGRELIRPAPNGLVIVNPASHSTVSREMIIEGKVTNAKMVWVVVRSKINGLCWVQPPIHVHDNGRWIGVIYVGRTSRKDNGYGYQLRAFVNPSDELQVGERRTSWPEAELATNALDVVRRVETP